MLGEINMDILTNVVVVLGPGRSGTSILMKILQSLGMKTSDSMLQGNLGNPDGYYEDLDILQVHKEVIDNFGLRTLFSEKADWLKTSFANKSILKLKDILNKNLNENNPVWGFKDPRTATVLPMWNRIFSNHLVKPKFVLIVRNPSSVAVSLMKQVGSNELFVEFQWLHRIVSTLIHTGGNVFIVHYEDLFTEKTPSILRDLQAFTGLDAVFSGDVDEVIKQNVKPQLNRSQWQEYQVKNRWVLALYDVLKNCRGADFDREKLMPVVYECQKVMDEFSGWSIATEQLVTKKQKQIESLKKIHTQKKSQEIEAIVLENNRLLKENIELSQRGNSLSVLKVERDQLSKQNDLLSKQNDLLSRQNDQLSKKIEQLCREKQEFSTLGGKTMPFFTKESYRFRLGHMLVKVYQNKFRIVILPFEMLVLGCDILSGRGRAKQVQAMKISSVAESRKIEESSSYQLGSLIFSAVRSPRKMNVLPEKIRKLYYAKG